MADGGTQSSEDESAARQPAVEELRAPDTENATESSRAEQLRVDQTRAIRAQMSGGGIPAYNGARGGSSPPDDPAQGEQEPSTGAEEGGEEGDYSPEENLVRSQASAGLAAQSAAQQGAPNVDDEIQKQTNSVNHYILELEGQLISIDVSTIGLALFLTIPFRLVFCTVLGYQLYNAVTGNKSIIPYFPELTVESFFPPGGSKISVPLPQITVIIAVLAYIILVVVLNIVYMGMLAFILYALMEPSGAMAAAMSLFSFFKTSPGT